MEQNTLKSRSAAQYYQDSLMIMATVAKTARTTAVALVHEHPYVLLFLLVFGVFLFPLSTTAIVGTLFLIFATSSTIFISVVFFAPALFMLTIFALMVWVASVLSLGAYRYVWAKGAEDVDLAKSRSVRYKMFRSTLENHQGTQSQQEILTALNMSTPLQSLLKRSLKDSTGIKRGSRSRRTNSLTADRSVRANLEDLLPSNTEKFDVNSQSSDFFPRDTDEVKDASPASEAA